MRPEEQKNIVASMLCALLVLSCLGVLFYIFKAQPFVKHQPTVAKVADDSTLGRIALIIDDWGYNAVACDFLKDIDIPVAVSVLPKLPYSRFSAQCAKQYQQEVMLHLPLEPEYLTENYPPGYVINSSFGEQKVVDTIADFLRSVPFAQGVNNHMGSKATKEKPLMQIIFRNLKSQNLFFIDSGATSGSVCEEVALKTRIAFAKRDVFLDNVSSREYIENQFKKLADLASRRGYAIGIAHAKGLTLEIIKEQSQKMRDQGFVFVPVTAILRYY